VLSEVKFLTLARYYCHQPTIDTRTQSEAGCRSNGTVDVPCFAAPNVTCGGVMFNGTECSFAEERSCRYVKLCGGVPCYSYRVAVALSLFLGMLGIDRFYLGYPAIGLAKLCTLGFMFIGHLVDFLLILVQAVGPADRSSYFNPYYGPVHYSINSTDPFLPASEQCA
jgi:TM2 domain-containing membrane protein YozV